eukprot:NODE_6375_length_512_cov_267.750547.p2 GENE.NODE_6375_length_512_cov_267.750547~~NODE_6375_length_512_cov_267.750547.p2  ORF type:complete len:75 (+),score=7.13 NODE_6375_length_512_cov_267.750547:218-442(+)
MMMTNGAANLVVTPPEPPAAGAGAGAGADARRPGAGAAGRRKPSELAHECIHDRQVRAVLTSATALLPCGGRTC